MATKIPTIAGADKNKESSIDLFCKKKLFSSFLKIALDKVGKITVAIAIPVIANGS